MRLSASASSAYSAMSVFASSSDRAAQDARDVDRHVADADDRGTLLREVEGEVAVVGMPVVPGDEFRGRMAAGEILAGNAHAPIGLGARRIDDLVVVPPEIRDGDVAAELDAAEEAKPRVRGDLVERAGDGLDLLVIGRHARAHEAVRRGHAIEQIDLGDDVLLLQQMIGRVEAGGPGADDCDSERLVFGSRSGHEPAAILTLLATRGASLTALTRALTLRAVTIREDIGDRVMKNVEMKIDGNILTITVDLSKEYGPSSSGKTTIIASTEGNVAVPNRDEKIGLNVYKKK